MKFIAGITLVFFTTTLFVCLPVFAEQGFTYTNESQFHELIGKWRQVKYGRDVPDNSMVITGVVEKALEGSFSSTYPFTVALGPENSQVGLMDGKIKVEIKIPTADYTLYFIQGGLSGTVYIKFGRHLGQTFKAAFQRQ